MEERPLRTTIVAVPTPRDKSSPAAVE